MVSQGLVRGKGWRRRREREEGEERESGKEGGKANLQPKRPFVDRSRSSAQHVSTKTVRGMNENEEKGIRERARRNESERDKEKVSTRNSPV